MWLVVKSAIRRVSEDENCGLIRVKGWLATTNPVGRVGLAVAREQRIGAEGGCGCGKKGRCAMRLGYGFGVWWRCGEQLKAGRSRGESWKVFMVVYGEDEVARADEGFGV
ncbi:unnamed protein product [Sphenostylis stenocarpa]|uniref:Uncharacterized protein n=1 Tax=Sphenostylis stenocarpa TaxID=92480 RepID=A0AA87BD36_9FABA|nr:unnamed protein product [Sphenostylis stenocarpa]